MAITQLPSTYQGTINITTSPNVNVSVVSSAYTGSVGQVYTIGAGGGGSSGAYLTSSNQWSSTSVNANLKISGKNPTLQTDKNEISIDEMAELLKMFKEIMFFAFEEAKVLEENPTLNDAYTTYKNKLKEKYSDPELQEAYNQYKLIKALSTEQKDYSK
jgi:hypothetical protein